MKKIKLEQADVYVSDDIHKELGFNELKDTESFYESKLKKFFEGENLTLDFKEYIDLYGKLNKLERLAMLHAHGNTDGNWIYSDGEKIDSIQNWINQKDGEYSALILYSCNPGIHTPASKKSILVIPDHNVMSRFTALYLSEKDTCYTILVPKIGEIDHYTIEYELNKLEKLK